MTLMLLCQIGVTCFFSTLSDHVPNHRVKKKPQFTDHNRRLNFSSSQTVRKCFDIKDWLRQPLDSPFLHLTEGDASPLIASFTLEFRQLTQRFVEIRAGD